MASVNWQKEVQPLLTKYRGKKHPLNYRSNYELLVMIILAAQATDELINQLAPDFFKAFPDIKTLSRAEAETVYPYIRKVRNYVNKTRWLLQLARTIQEDKNIPQTLSALTELPGIGRKSAHVFMRETGLKSEGIIIDLHVLRVVPRIGLTNATDPSKMEKQLMNLIDQKDWGEIGMSLSFLGREVCRPTNPACSVCVMKKVCVYFQKLNN